MPWRWCQVTRKKLTGTNPPRHGEMATEILEETDGISVEEEILEDEAMAIIAVDIRTKTLTTLPGGMLLVTIVEMVEIGHLEPEDPRGNQQRSPSHCCNCTEEGQPRRENQAQAERVEEVNTLQELFRE